MVETGHSRSTAQWLRLLALYLGVGVFVLGSQPTGRSAAIGLPILAMGMGIRFWASGHLIKTERLITSGPYAYVRNPLYLGRLLIFVGLTLACPWPRFVHWVVLAVGLIIFFGYYMRRKETVEPDRLRQRHASYARYFEEVRSLWPRLTRWPDAESERWNARRFSRNREWILMLVLCGMSVWIVWRAVSPQ